MACESEPEAIVKEEKLPVLHLLYILAFTLIAFIAVSNLLRSLVALGGEAQEQNRRTSRPPRQRSAASEGNAPSHPEMFDENGRPLDEPLLVMRSMSVEDARQRLDALYESSPGSNPRREEES